MINISLWVIILAIIVVFYLMLKESKIVNKLLLVNYLTTLVALIIAILSSINGKSSYLDITIIYILTSYLANIAFAKYFTEVKKNDRET